MTKAEKIINMLESRKGFDYWWHEMNDEINQEIIKKIELIINES